MKSILIGICMLLGLSAYCQNLVPNPSFELHSECPTGLNYGSYFVCSNWVSARFSADYYNSCATGAANTPAAAEGYQKPLDGNAYVGFYAYNGGPFKEFIMADIPALEIDTEYVVTINVSFTINSYCSNYAVDGFGVQFNTYGPPPGYTVPVPQVDYSHYGIIADTTNWVTLTDTFTADSAYTHLVIGDFKDGAALHTLFVGTNATGDNAYYYIDKVSVVKKSQAHLLNIPMPEANELTFYPNPVTSTLNIISSLPITTVYISDVLGQTVYSNHFNSLNVQVDAASLPPGMYFVKVNGVEPRRFIKQ